MDADLFVVRPSIFIPSGIGVITFQAEQMANGDMHEILFLLLGKRCPDLPQFLDTDQQQDCIHIGQGIVTQGFFDPGADFQPAEIEFPIFHRGAKIENLER